MGKRLNSSTVFILYHGIILANLLQCVQLEEQDTLSTSTSMDEDEQCLNGWDDWSECGGCRRLSQRFCKDNDDLIETKACVIGKHYTNNILLGFLG